MTTILVADDRPLNRAYLVTLLSYSGHRVVEASDGAEALALAEAERPGLVITDMIMPGMDGLELVLRMKAEPKLAGIPVIFYSATYSLGQARAVARDLAVFGVLPKPSEPEVILKLVNTALGLPPWKPTSSLPAETPAHGPLSSVAPGLPGELVALEAISSRLAALIEMSLELAAERDPEHLLQGFAHMARKLLSSRYAVVGLLGDDGRTIERIFFSGMQPAASLPAAISPSSPLEEMLRERRPLLLRGLTTESLGLPFPTPVLSSFLGVPVFTPSRLHGWLCLVDKLGAEEFTAEDARVAATLASQVALTYEKMEEARRVEDELRESWAMFESLFEASPDAIAAIHEDGRIARVNTQTERLFGYTREQLVGQPVETLVPERFRRAHPAHRQQYCAKPGRRPIAESQDLYGLRKDGTEFPVDIMLSHLETRQGSLVLSVVRDVTARKAKEERIRQLNHDLEQRVHEVQAANSELEAFSYSVSHDLRAPVRAMTGFARILEEEHAARLDGEGHRLLQVIRTNAGKMGDLIDGLLTLSFLGRQRMKKGEVGMTELASEVVEEARQQESSRSLEIGVQPLPATRGDRAMLRQVFTNLVSNALKFTRDRSPSVIEIGSCPKGAEIVYYVKDNGAGFDMRYAHRLFGVFQRLHSEREFQGTGIGLALVQRIVHQHGGRVWAEGVIGQGATVYFTLPGNEAAGE
jgi:PAS domain S-box-containing protein